jgi:tRNA-binding EMAP/Myf-like protein
VIRSAAPHPSADKLYVLEVDVGGTTPRTVVAGIRGTYSVEELRDRAVVLLTNLAPRTIRRITSQGMVLAAEAGEHAILLEPPNGVSPGTYLDGRTATDRTISYDEFASTSLTVGQVTGSSGEGRIRVDVGGAPIELPGSAPEGTWVVVRSSSGPSARSELLSFGGSRYPRPSGPVPAGAKVR